MKLIARHGDVYLFAIDRAALPKTAKKTTSRILAEGEVTGHAHRLTGEVDVFEDTDGTLYLVPLDDAAVIHEEHTVIPLRETDIGDDLATTRIQREYNPYTRRAQEVKD